MVLRGTPASIERGYAIDVYCVTCSASSAAAKVGECERVVHSRKRARGRAENRITCDVCRKHVGSGGVKVSISGSPEDRDAREMDGEAPEFSVEVVCVSCREHYAFCTECGGGGKHRTGKYRPIELFTSGRRTCGLSHVRFGDAAVSYRVHEITASPATGVTPALLAESRAVFADGITSFFASPRSMENPTSRLATIPAIRATIDRAWAGVEDDIKATVDGTERPEIRKYFQAAYIPRIPRKKTRTTRSVPVAQDLASETAPPPPAADHVQAAFLTAAVDAARGTLLVNQFGARMMAMQSATLARDMVARCLGRARRDAGAASVKHVWVEVERGEERMAAFCSKLGAIPLGAYLKKHPGLDGGIFEAEAGRQIYVIDVAIAARLVHKGYNVTVVEQNSFTGGRCSLIHQDGYRFDQGPSLWLMPKVFEETFASVGERLADHVDLMKCDPNYVVHFADGRRLTLTTDIPRLKDEVEKFEPGAFGGLLGFLDEGRTHYEMSLGMVLMRNYEYFWEMFTLRNLVAAFRLHVLSSLWGRVGRYFKSEHLRQAFTFQSMYMGMSPFEAPGTYNLLQYTELAEALQKIAESRGAKFLLSSPVANIDISPYTNEATGVRLASGQKLSADIVICNADLVTAYNRLLPPSPYSRYLATLNQTCSTFNFYWGLDRTVPELDGHNVFLAGDYRASFEDIFKRHGMPDCPSFYVHVPSRLDPAAAPPGKDALTVLVPVSSIRSDPSTQDWKDMHRRARAAVLEALAARLPSLKDLDRWIVTERVNTPSDWRETFGLWGGSVLGLSHEVAQVLYMRPATRHASHGNVFFVGASTHPGAGVPIALCGARIVEEQIRGIVEKGKGFGRFKACGGRVGVEGFVLIVAGAVAVLAVLLFRMVMRECFVGSAVSGVLIYKMK
ncbi:hypothetical protein HK101_000932 [Irineochytrium annulatum]|nr:hypothetical protein HK101_000932 [Irineochytrium annulatum]